MLYLVPTFIGVQATDFGSISDFSSLFISSQHPVFAAGMAYVSMALCGALGLVAVFYVVFSHASVANDTASAPAMPAGVE